MNTDSRGCPVGSTATAAIDHTETALWRLVSYYGDALADLDAAIAADPGWLLPRVMKVNALLFTGEQPYAAQAAQLLHEAQPLAAAACTRERMHLAASNACAENRWDRACELWEAILVEYPRDLLALLSAYLFDFYRGDSASLQRRVQRVLPAWSADLPLYSYVLGLQAFGLEECNQYERALDSSQAALQLEPRDPWAIHATAHVHEMRGDHERGRQWLQQRQPVWSPDNGFAFHNWWHLALFNLEAADTVTTLELFDHHIAIEPAMALQHVDITALLWRLTLMGVDVGPRWQQAAALWPLQEPASGHYAFNDFHAVLAHVGAGNVEPALRLLSHVQRKAGENSAPGRMAATVGVPLVRAVLAYAAGDFATASDELLAVRGRAHAFGGSHAQRDIIKQTLLDASIRAGRRSLARHLLNERLPAKRGTALTEYWQRRAA